MAKRISCLCYLLLPALAMLCVSMTPVHAKEKWTEEGWIRNRATHYWYRLTAPMDWFQAEAQAVEWEDTL